MRLQKGDKAPDFSVEDIDGRPVRLADHAADKLMLCFYRYAGCPFCNLALFEIINHHQMFAEAGLKVVAFFQSQAELVRKYPARQKPPFPLVADPTMEVYKRYGVELSVAGTFRSSVLIPRFYEAVFKHHFEQPAIDGDFFLMPAEFLISPGGVVHSARYWKNFADHTAFKDIIRFCAFES